MTVRITGRLTVGMIAEFLGIDVGTNDAPVTGVTTDSRDVEKGSLFIALAGERVDGHDFIASALDKGAVLVIAERIPDNCGDRRDRIIVVENAVKALGAIAANYKAQYASSVLTVAVTGSVGKTTTKEMIASVLSEQYKTLKTEANHNNHLGMPMTVLELNETYKAAVLEMGMSGFGEITYLSTIGRPDIAVITNIGTSHIEKLGSREGIRNAKMEIVNGMPANGKLILNGDEPLLAGIDGAYYVSLTNPDAYAYVSRIESGENGTAFDLTIEGERIESIVIPVLGVHNVLDAAYAYVVGKLAGVGEFAIRRGLKGFENVGMRQKLNKVGERLFIEDCYNASPESMEASLWLLSQIKRERPGVAVLGEMRELGNYSQEGHFRVGSAVARYGVDLLYTFGKEALWIAQGAICAGMDPEKIVSVEDLSDYEGLAGRIEAEAPENGVVLFKASRAIALENVVNILKDRKKS